ncbi:N-acetyltransferase [Methanolobus mangrovi]|uniref:N-acetyltransferase n=1 Tax=Methanolobus mangrovi TaxID=3072977 RepID=A0AA51YHS9_9EURY|nr:N-acetyltransferase [Methanolobus mangrovi]WMW23476.1 N-acetyltransferase [Methanolobus mangrovi]
MAECRDVFLDRMKVFPEGFLVMEIDREIAGYISSEMWEYSENIDTDRFCLNHTIREVHIRGGSELYISSIGILKKYRGKGYGKMLFSELVEQIRSKYKITSIILIVSVNWDAARKIYENNGFLEIQRINGFFEDDENSDAIVMRKYL